MMKLVLRLLLAMSLMLTATSSFAWFGGNNNNWGPWGGGNNNNWGPWGNNNGYNQYDEWDPRYWMDEMEDAFDNNDDYYGGPYGGYGGPGPYGPPPGYYGPGGPNSYGPPPGYYGPGGPGPYGPPPGYRPNTGPGPYGPQGSAPQGGPQ